jgi:hypothetical protein
VVLLQQVERAWNALKDQVTRGHRQPSATAELRLLKVEAAQTLSVVTILGAPSQPVRWVADVYARDVLTPMVERAVG